MEHRSTSLDETRDGIGASNFEMLPNDQRRRIAALFFAVGPPNQEVHFRHDGSPRLLSLSLVSRSPALGSVRGATRRRVTTSAIARAPDPRRRAGCRTEPAGRRERCAAMSGLRGWDRRGSRTTRRETRSAGAGSRATTGSSAASASSGRQAESLVQVTGTPARSRRRKIAGTSSSSTGCRSRSPAARTEAWARFCSSRSNAERYAPWSSTVAPPRIQRRASRCCSRTRANARRIPSVFLRSSTPPTARTTGPAPA